MSCKELPLDRERKLENHCEQSIESLGSIVNWVRSGTKLKFEVSPHRQNNEQEKNISTYNERRDTSITGRLQIFDEKKMAKKGRKDQHQPDSCLQTANTVTFMSNRSWLTVMLVGLGGLGIMYSPQDPRFAGSNLAEVDEFFSGRKNPEHKSSGRTLSRGSRVSDFRLVKEPQAWKKIVLWTIINLHIHVLVKPKFLSSRLMRRQTSPITLPLVENKCN